MLKLKTDSGEAQFSQMMDKSLIAMEGDFG